MFVVAGVTGHVGASAAHELLSKGQKVRVIARDAKKAEPFAKQGAEVLVGSLEDKAFLTKALGGAAGAFLLLPPNFAAPDFRAFQHKLADVLVAAVKDSAVPHVVLLSSIGADLEAGTGPITALHYLERHLRDTGTKLTAIRAGFFMENTAMNVGTAKAQGISPNFMDESVAMPMVATKDIGHQVAQALLEPAAKSTVIDITGPAYTAAQVAALIAERIGKPVKVVTIPEPGWLGALMQGGLSKDIAGLYVEMYTAFSKGLARPCGDRMAQGTTTLEEVLKTIA
jgi:uncharacterized protein YbjT (DUF2867 family)